MWIITDEKKIAAVEYVVSCDGYRESRIEDVKKCFEVKETISYFTSRNVPCLTLRSIDAVADVDAVLEKLKEIAGTGKCAVKICGDIVLLYVKTIKYNAVNLEELVDMVSYELESKENIVKSW